MPHSPTTSPNNNKKKIETISISNSNSSEIEIPVEIISDEEMAVIESAFSYASTLRRPFSLLSSRVLYSGFSSSSDVEDLGRPIKKRTKLVVVDSLFTRFRKNKALSVTDITASEWCEKQVEFGFIYGKPEITEAMKAGIARHAKLEKEVTQKIEVRVETREDIWALKFMNFTICANQLLFDGLTRELPVVGFVQGVWMVGVIDEIRMPSTGNERNLILVDTKTRRQPRIPAEPQCRNGRLQLMCYKYLWDMLVSDNFPSAQFYEYFSLDPEHTLSDEIKMSTAHSGFPCETLSEVVNYFRNVCLTLPAAHDRLLLRYELLEDYSLIAEDEFSYDYEWLKGQIRSSLEFWQGKREANYVPKDELWKCRFCKFQDICPSQIEANSKKSSQNNSK